MKTLDIVAAGDLPERRTPMIRTLSLLALALAFFALPRAGAQPAPDDPTIVEVAAADADFSTLVTALEAAGLVDALQAEGPFTVFAPADAAFRALPEGTVATLLEPENVDTLRAILTYHVVPGRLEASDVAARSSLETLQGESLPVTVEDGIVRVGGAKVVATDVPASNGVIHVVDAVLLPEAAR